MSRPGQSRGYNYRVKRWRGDSSLRDLYLLYYSTMPDLKLPEEMQRREFAFQLFDGQSYVRHLSFSSRGEFFDFILSRPPRHAYYSTAIYELPEAGSMEEKGWIGSELLFDIDVDYIGDCNIVTASNGASIPGDDCIMRGLDAAFRASEILLRDFSVESIIYYTGNRGFHIRGMCDYCLELGRDERREMAAYLSAEGLNLNILFPRLERRAKPSAPAPSDPGWRGWIAIYLGVNDGPIEEAVGEDWEFRVGDVIDEVRVPVDMQVTQDISRLARIPGSLNGKASLLVVEIEEKGDFRMGRELSPFRGSLEVRSLVDLPSVEVLGESISLREGETLSMEAHLALYLATRGLVEPVGGEVYV